ncbi:MAG TPA: hypothetical protein VMM14_09340 [Acidimicrobiia bacterium]|nr:hypothetical protein [Acidimicrobiia bacterium]
MGTPESDQKTPVSRPGPEQRTGASIGALIAVVMVLIPVSAIAMAWALIAVTNNLDVAFALGVSDVFLVGIFVAASGLIAGVAAALLSGLEGWNRIVPPVVGLLAGLGTYLAFALFEQGARLDTDDLGLIATVWLAQATAIVMATRLVGHRLVAAVAAVAVVGIGVAATVQSIPEPPAEVTLVLEEYTVDATGSCVGAGELSQFAGGLEVEVLELPETSGQPTELATIVLPPGVEEPPGCVFDLGNPLGTTLAGYVNVDFRPATDPNSAMTSRFEGHRMIITYFGSEG